ncbi:MAG: NADPH-dependent F420 reductase [Actinobacteria bacterium]|nr:NADPH-dependent F420 reductase [Actinomycetota bacterium]MCL5444910.1 NADPH-dependent F420 reductase [Actinomycetota bacterium]
MEIGILGGTGPAGRGLAARLAASGVGVVLGSRDERRAELIAGELSLSLPKGAIGVEGASNEEAARAEIVVVATPWESTTSVITPLEPLLVGKVVISMVNALQKEGREMLALIPPRGSVAATIQATLPQSLVAAAFHHLPASEMLNLDSGLSADVLVCSDHREAIDKTIALVDRMEGLRGLNAGSLHQAMAIEAFTAVCITVNIASRAHSSVRMSGI